MQNRINVMNFNDTFLDADHLLKSFPNDEVTFRVNNEILPPYRLVKTIILFLYLNIINLYLNSFFTFFSIHFQETTNSLGKNFKKVNVQSVKAVNRGPYKFNQPKK